jgi:hypothetical protein
MSSNICDKLTFNDCELAILRMAVDKAEQKIALKIVNSPDIKIIINILEKFIKHKKLICYGGTAINNLLPQEDKFYDKDLELPDYDCFSYNALEDAKELAKIYYKKGFKDVEAKAGQHYGTYKVYVNYLPIADITYLPKEIFYSLKNDSIEVEDILYASPNFLRMSMYLELSRPAGDVSRWEKVLKRLTLLNKYYPITSLNCESVNFQREMEDTNKEEEIFDIVKNTLIDCEVVFFGGYAIALYSQYMPKKLKRKVREIADFDILSQDPEKTAKKVKHKLEENGIKNVHIIKRPAVGEIIPIHYQINIENETIAIIYKPIACHSYNTIRIKNKKLKIATVDTMLSFYFAFLYSNRSYYNQYLDRILCISKFLFQVQQKNRLKQKGLLKRFSIHCYGKQETLEDIRAHKAEKYKELKNKPKTKEYEEWFLNYRPADRISRKYREKHHQRNSTTSKLKTKKNRDRKHII